MSNQGKKWESIPESQLSSEEKSKILFDEAKTPQFLYKRWEVILHYTAYAVAMVYIFSTMHNYIVSHYPEVKNCLERSHLSDFIESTFLKVSFSNIKDMELVQLFAGFQINIYRYSKNPQWESYRNNLWLLVSMALIWRCLTYIFYLFDIFILNKNPNSNPNHFNYVNKYIFVFSLCILLFSFRADIVFYLGIIILWWVYIEALRKFRTFLLHSRLFQNLTLSKFNNWAIVSLWIIVIITLYLNQKFNHFRLLSSQFEQYIPDFLEPLKNSHRTIHCSQFLNMTFLRLISYGMDRLHQNDTQWLQKQNQMKKKKFIPCENCQKESNIIRYCNQGRDHIIKPTHCLKDYLNYTLYTPLLLTGPPISYNNFFSYSQIPSPRVSFKQCIYHVFLILSFQVYLHLIPVVTPNPSMTLAEMEMFSLFQLVFIWYKFLIIWKTAKLWSKIYGVEVIDNMSRCIFNNYGFQGFWRMWHRGFNHWLIRYLYVPLGGKSNIFSVLAVVCFVSFWHDHTINIVFWGLIIAMFMVPEILIKRYFRNHKKHWYSTYWFKYVAGFASSIYIHFLIICNCIGFGYGMGQMELVFNKILNQYQTIFYSILVVWPPTLCMFHIRNLEGNKKNY